MSLNIAQWRFRQWFIGQLDMPFGAQRYVCMRGRWWFRGIGLSLPGSPSGRAGIAYSEPRLRTVCLLITLPPLAAAMMRTIVSACPPSAAHLTVVAWT